MRSFLTSRLGWFFALVHSCLFALGMYQRAGAFHFVYEPFVLQIIVVVDFIWLMVADWLGLGSLQYPTSSLVFMGLIGGIQSFIIGYGISLLRKKWTPESRPA